MVKNIQPMVMVADLVIIGDSRDIINISSITVHRRQISVVAEEEGEAAAASSHHQTSIISGMDSITNNTEVMILKNHYHQINDEHWYLPMYPHK